MPVLDDSHIHTSETANVFPKAFAASSNEPCVSFTTVTGYTSMTNSSMP